MTTLDPPAAVLGLVERFEANRAAYESAPYNETQVRREFIDPLPPQAVTRKCVWMVVVAGVTVPGLTVCWSIASRAGVETSATWTEPVPLLR